MPLHEYIASRLADRRPPDIDGVSFHAQQRAFKRLGVWLPRSTWEAFHAGICADVWAWQHGTGDSRVYHVPVEANGRRFMLPLAVRYCPTPIITTVLDLIPG
jgi:hypothetical protein